MTTTASTDPQVRVRPPDRPVRLAARRLLFPGGANLRDLLRLKEQPAGPGTAAPRSPTASCSTPTALTVSAGAHDRVQTRGHIVMRAGDHDTSTGSHRRTHTAGLHTGYDISRLHGPDVPTVRQPDAALPAGRPAAVDTAITLSTMQTVGAGIPLFEYSPPGSVTSRHRGPSRAIEQMDAWITRRTRRHSYQYVRSERRTMPQVDYWRYIRTDEARTTKPHPKLTERVGTRWPGCGESPAVPEQRIVPARLVCAGAAAHAGAGRRC